MVFLQRTNNKDLIAHGRAPTIYKVNGVMEQQLTLADFLDEKNANGERMAEIRAYQADSKKHDGLVTQAQARAVLGVSSGRVGQLVKAGTLLVHEHFGQRLIACDQLIEYARLQKIDGGTGAALIRAFKAQYADFKKKG
jgi:hypothetical protein